jgi:hypothetical protein
MNNANETKAQSRNQHKGELQMPRPKILVVDDDPDLLRALRLRLRANNL